MRRRLVSAGVVGWLIVALLATACGDQDGRVVDWHTKDAHRHCRAAIAAYPARPSPPCSALHLCANEAVLDPAEQARLREMIRATPGCAEP